MTKAQDQSATAAPLAPGRWTLTVTDGTSTTVEVEHQEGFDPQMFTEHLRRRLGYYTSNVHPVLNGGSPWDRAEGDDSYTTPVHPVTQAASHTAHVRLDDGRWTLAVDDGPSHPYGAPKDPFSASQATRQLIMDGFEVPGLEYHRPLRHTPWTEAGQDKYTTVCYPSRR
ncbi:hypothetical protein [Streptomyces microflavus]|uniref:hypothetical protein n=1 Tax=Streptomyces microflavus TaxID=1919 RepID=UPI00381264B8